jgi:hypothetical protein
MQVMFRQIEREPRQIIAAGIAELRLNEIADPRGKSTAKHRSDLLNRRVASSCARQPHEVD